MCPISRYFLGIHLNRLRKTRKDLSGQLAAPLNLTRYLVHTSPLSYCYTNLLGYSVICSALRSMRLKKTLIQNNFKADSGFRWAQWQNTMDFTDKMRNLV